MFSEKVKHYALVAGGALASFAVAVPAFAAELFDIPSIDALTASTSPTTNGSFLLFLGIGLFILGFFLGVSILVALIRMLRRGVGRVLSGAGAGGGGRRRRRR